MTPDDLAILMAENVAEVFKWVGAGIGGGLLLFYVFMGIRKGFEFFQALAGSGASQSDMIAFYRAQDDREYQDYQADEDWLNSNALDERDLL